MGASFSSDAVIGVRLEKLLTIKREKTKTTKYNPDTGQPYQQESFQEHYFWGNEEIEDPNDDMEDFVEKKCGLEMYTSGARDDRIVGYLIAQSEPGEVHAVTLDEINQWWLEVKEKLHNSGCKDFIIALHVIGYMS